MEGKRLIKSLRLQNLLSYGSKGETIELEPLNVLIGRNASGKSNLIEALSLLQAAPGDISAPFRYGGSINDWLWKGSQFIPEGMIETIVDYPEGVMSVRYRLIFTMIDQRIRIRDEVIEKDLSIFTDNSTDHFFSYRNGEPISSIRTLVRDKKTGRIVREERYSSKVEINSEQSVLSQLRGADQFPEITYLANTFNKFKFFRYVHFGPYVKARLPQKTDLPEDFLLEDYSNLALVLNDLNHRRAIKPIIDNLKRFHGRVIDITTKVAGGTLQVFIHEEGLSQPIPAVRLSDGTIRYLCLLVILCHPNPPSLLCIEEPELGLHPDVLPVIAELLVEASQRTQLIVTTHSDVLVSALSHVPESILVCERDEDGSHLRRLEPEPLKERLDKYSLGELWRMGEIGGNV